MGIVGFIVEGDRTSHGGTVLECKSRWFIDGIPGAQVGDPVWCPRCNRMTRIVTSRFPQFKRNGVAAAFDQDTTDCGAVLYSRHNGHAGFHVADDPGSAAGAKAGTASATGPVARAAGRAQEHFVVQDSGTRQGIAGVKYTLTTDDGRTVEGETDEQGRTDVVWTAAPDGVDVALHGQAGESDDPYHFPEQLSEDAGDA